MNGIRPYLIVALCLIVVQSIAQKAEKNGGVSNFELKLWATHPFSQESDTVYLSSNFEGNDNYLDSEDEIDTFNIGLNSIGIRIKNNEVKNIYNTGCKGNLKIENKKFDTTSFIILDTF